MLFTTHRLLIKNSGSATAAGGAPCSKAKVCIQNGGSSPVSRSSFWAATSQKRSGTFRPGMPSPLSERDTSCAPSSMNCAQRGRITPNQAPLVMPPLIVQAPGALGHGAVARRGAASAGLTCTRRTPCECDEAGQCASTLRAVPQNSTWRGPRQRVARRAAAAGLGRSAESHLSLRRGTGRGTPGGRDETYPVSTGGRDETCPVSTGGKGGGGHTRPCTRTRPSRHGFRSRPRAVRPRGPTSGSRHLPRP